MTKIVSLMTGTATLVLTTFALAQDAMPGPQVGQTFPHELAAPDQSGQAQTLDSVMGQNGAVVFFVRSADWCPFCQRQLADVNGRLAEFQALGLNVVSVSVDSVEMIDAFSEEHDIAYTMLADPTGDINKVLGIRDEQYPVGHHAFGVPRPVLYVIDTDHTIRLAYMEPTYRTRPDLDIVLADAARLEL